MMRTGLDCVSKEVMVQRVTRLEEQHGGVLARLAEVEDALANREAIDGCRQGEAEVLDLGDNGE